MACGKFKHEFKCKNFLLDHPHPEYFTTSQWKWPPIVYVLYRMVATLYLLVWLVLSGVLGSDGSFWFIYLTNWTFLLLNLKTVIMTITAILGYMTTKTAVADIGGSSTEKKIPWYLKMQWVIYNMATTASLVVTVAYWVLLWEPDTGVSANNFHMHAFNSIYVLIDLFITATPIRLLHFWHPVCYGVVYLIFTLVYTGTGGTDIDGNNYIYSILDFYGNPSTAVLYFLAVLLVGLPLLWLFEYGMICLRVFLSQRCCPCGRDYHKDQEKGNPIAGRSEDKRHSMEKSKDEEEGRAREKAVTSDGDQPLAEGHQSVVFVTESSGGHINKAFDNTNE